MLMRGFAAALINVLAFTLLPNVCFGQIEVPSDAEFLAWPDYCQARFVQLPVGEQSQWATKISRAQIEIAKRAIGETAFLSIHHACAGSMWLERARYEKDKTRRNFMYNQVTMETSYTLARVPETSPLMPGLLANMAAAARGLGNDDRAVEYLQHAVELLPENPATYVSLGLLYRSMGDLQKSRDVFVRGSKATGESSPELNYDFALLLLQLKEFPLAVHHARLAYSLGFPLPGLKNKLKKLGLWDTPVPPSAAQ